VKPVFGIFGIFRDGKRKILDSLVPFFRHLVFHPVFEVLFTIGESKYSCGGQQRQKNKQIDNKTDVDWSFHGL